MWRAVDDLKPWNHGGENGWLRKRNSINLAFLGADSTCRVWGYLAIKAPFGTQDKKNAGIGKIRELKCHTLPFLGGYKTQELK
jgi:hypothetical protein